MEPTKFQKKWEELNRAFRRLSRFYSNDAYDQEDDFQGPKDFVHNFFRISYELKETVKKTEGIPPKCSRVIESFIDDRPVLALGMDITNQEKHIKLTKSRSGQKIGKINSHVHMLDPDGRNRTEITIEIDGVKQDCLALARETIEEWDEFFASYSLT